MTDGVWGTEWGKHQHRLEDYGLTPAQVEEAFRLRTPMRR